MQKKKSKRDDANEDNGFAQWGGYMAAKKAKLEDQFLMQAEKEKLQKSNIFEGVSIFVNGYTVPAADELRRIMMVHGGVYHHYESSSTTHIIASNLPNVKIKRLKESTVVKPSWIVDSVAAGHLLDFRKYLLYSNQTKSQPHLCFSTTTSERSGSIEVQRPENSVHCEEERLDNCAEGSQSMGAASDMERNTTECVGNEQRGSATENKDGEHVSTLRKPRYTAVEPQFLSEFYSNSRLHHLSTMGAMFKAYVARLRDESKGSFPGMERLCHWKKQQGSDKPINYRVGFVDDSIENNLVNDDCADGLKTIMHVDMDCFFVSVGLRSRPELKGLPVAVTHAKGNQTSARSGADRRFERDFYRERFHNRLRQKQGAPAQVLIERTSRLDEVSELDSLSEIASCNYEARKAGVKNGMFFGAALKHCPSLKTIPYDFEGYKEVSFKLYDILASYTLDIEAVSCDEMYVDCTAVLKKANVTVSEFATFLRKEIETATGCTASAGFGPNPFLARLATKRAKPNGYFCLQSFDVEHFMYNIKVEDLPGVGNSLAYRLHGEGVSTCRDLQLLPLSSLQRKFGMKTGGALYRHCRGEDKRALDVCHQRKSVSAEVNYGIRFCTQCEAEAFLKQLVDEVVLRMNEARVKGRHITLKLMVRAKDAPVETAKFLGHGACDNISRSFSLAVATDDPDTIYREAVALERQLKVLPSDLRGVGIQISRLTLGNTTKNTVLTDFLKQGAISYKKSTPEKMQEELRTLDKLKEVAAADVRNENNSKHFVKGQNKRTNRNECNTANSNKLTDREFSPLLEVPMMTLCQARKLIRAWTATTQGAPQECDVLMFVSYTQQLVIAHHLEELNILLNLLHRCILKKGSEWKAAYKTIVKFTQEVMRRVYEYELKILPSSMC